MSFSLMIQHGDLALSGTSLGTVIDAAKLQQDLSCTILTPLGSDEMHPLFGSTLDELSGVYGEQDWNYAATVVRSELLRICQNYQSQQIARNELDGTRFGRFTLSPGEILLKVNSTNFIQSENRLLCILNLEIGNENLEIKVPVG